MSALIFILPMPTDSVTVFVALFRCGQKARKARAFFTIHKAYFYKTDNLSYFYLYNRKKIYL